jgi:hypothetical protein
MNKGMERIFLKHEETPNHLGITARDKSQKAAVSLGKPQKNAADI